MRYVGLPIVAVLLLLVVCDSAQAHPQSEADRRCHRHTVRRLVRCLARKIGSPGGPDKAERVARCESGLNPRASDGSHVGLYQHARAYWGPRVRHYQGRYISPLRARANAAVALKMARDARSWAAWPECGRR